MTVKQIRKIAATWAVNNGKLVEKSKGSAREQYRGFMMACYAVCDLIDGNMKWAKALANDTQ
jgi:hypothetical protein